MDTTSREWFSRKNIWSGPDRMKQKIASKGFKEKFLHWVCPGKNGPTLTGNHRLFLIRAWSAETGLTLAWPHGLFLSSALPVRIGNALTGYQLEQYRVRAWLVFLIFIEWVVRSNTKFGSDQIKHKFPYQGTTNLFESGPDQGEQDLSWSEI